MVVLGPGGTYTYVRAYVILLRKMSVKIEFKSEFTVVLPIKITIYNNFKFA